MDELLKILRSARYKAHFVDGTPVSWRPRSARPPRRAVNSDGPDAVIARILETIRVNALAVRNLGFLNAMAS